MSLRLQPRIKDDLAGFFEDPSKESLRSIIAEYDGEQDFLDFKEEMVEKSKLARHILAMANSGGGVIIFGVKENDDGSLSVEGLDEFEDHSELGDQISTYLPEGISGNYSFEDFEYSAAEYDEIEGEKFQVLFINYEPLIIPLVSSADGNYIDEGQIYVRNNTSSEKATSSEVKTLIRRRMEAEANKPGEDLKENLEQLELLYKHYPASESSNSIVNMVTNLVTGPGTSIRDKLDEEHERFMRTLLEHKKKDIGNDVGYDYSKNDIIGSAE